MKRRLTYVLGFVLLALLFPVFGFVTRANPRVAINNVMQVERAGSETHLVVVTCLNVNYVWVAHGSPQRFPQAGRIGLNRRNQTWEVFFTPENRVDQTVQVWASEGFWEQGADVQPFFIDVDENAPIIVSVEITPVAGNIRATIVTEGHVNNVWARHSSPERFPHAVRIDQNGTRQYWQVVFNLMNIGTQTFTLYANEGFWTDGAASQSHTLYIQNRGLGFDIRPIRPRAN